MVRSVLFEKKKIITVVLVDKKVCMYGYLKTRLQRSLVNKGLPRLEFVQLSLYRNFTIRSRVDIASFVVAHSLEYMSAYL